MFESSNPKNLPVASKFTNQMSGYKFIQYCCLNFLIQFTHQIFIKKNYCLY